MVDIYVRYDGDLHCSARHAPSGATLATDAPVDNQGRGEAFSPTDLLATALGTCMLTVMGIRAKQRSWNIDGSSIHVIKEMTKNLPRRVERLRVTLDVPESIARVLSEEARRELEQVADTCPVRLSLHPQIDVPVEFKWGVI
ncbi:MAG TPA: OsmC family protein [Polyangiales bacterium]|jgi:putative redox protein